MFTVKLGAVVTALSMLAALPAVADEPPAQAELKVEAAFDKAAYTSGALVKLTLKVTNVGPVAAEKVVQLADGGNFYPNAQDWGDLQYGKGVRIEAGEVRVFEVSGYLLQVVDVVTSKGRLLSPTARPVYDPMWDLTSSVRAATGGWHGVVYGDANANGTADPGEYLTGAEVVATGGAPYKEYKTVTDAAGKFEFTNIPTGRYSTYYNGTNGWLLYGSNEQIVEEGVSGETIVRGLRPLSDRLKVSLTFKKKNYQVGDLVKATVKLTNRGTTPINGITAMCNGIGNENQLSGNTAGWGPLVYNAGGVSLAPGQTKVIPVEEAVPAAAREWGEVVAGCGFGPSTEDSQGFPNAGDGARVAGLHRDITVKVTHFETGAAVAGVKVLLTDRYTKKVVAQPVTDAEGRFEVRDLQFGVYDVTYAGPWKAGSEGYKFLQVWAHTSSDEILSVLPCP